MLLELNNLTVEFPAPQGRVARTPESTETGTRQQPPLRPQALAAASDLSLSLDAGETLALVGESGSGKSVTALAIMGLLPPQARLSGSVRFEGRELTTATQDELRHLRGARMSMIFQEPMTALNPVMRVGDQISEAIVAHDGKLSKTESRAQAIEALREVAIPQPERRWRDYPHQLSGGQRQRVMIAMAIVNRPALLIADEPTTALDVTVQAQILELLAELRRRLGLAMLFVSHDLAVVARVSHRIAVMYAGRIVESGPAEAIFQRPAHPYTRGLLASIPTLKTDRSQPLRAIEGSVPSPAALPPGCAFAPRCPLNIPECDVAVPELMEIEPGHKARCIRALSDTGSAG